MSFFLIAVLVLVLVAAGMKLARHDAKSRPGAESHGTPPSPPSP